MPTLSGLPSDVYAVILSHVPPPERQRAVLNLSRALPRSSVPTNQIFNHIIVYTSAAVIHLCNHFRQRKDYQTHVYNPSELVKSISVRAWFVEADLVVDLLALLPSVPIIHMSIGTTYAPEHLRDIFASPRPALRTLQLRFKPYGAYFDSTIIQLANWPMTKGNYLRNLSITQDTISYNAHIKFAQPLAFFSFKPLSDLAVSPIGQLIQSLRISVPAKPVINYIGSTSNSFPQLIFLDISTTTLPSLRPERAIGTLLSRLARLRHVIIDRSAGPLPRDSPGWEALGRACALAGVERAKEKEQEIQEWMDRKRQEEAAAAHGDEGEALPAPVPLAPTPAPRTRRGRRGLATATISLRDPRPTPNAPAASSSSTRDPTARHIRIVPSPPTLQTFSTAYAGPSNPSPQQRSDWSQAFVKGFLDGCGTLKKIWQRIQDSATVRVMRFVDTDSESFYEDDDAPAVLRGVAEVAIAGHWIGWEPSAPIICFGSERPVIRLNRDGDDGQSLVDTLNQTRIGNIGAFDGATPSTAIVSQGEAPSTIGTVSSANTNDPPSSVGGLWEEEDFIEWGPGHTDGCGHDIGRRFFG